MNYFANSAGSIPGAQFAERLIEDAQPDASTTPTPGPGEREGVQDGAANLAPAPRRQEIKILFRERDWHGGTLATMSAGGQPQRVVQYGPSAPGFVEVPHCMEYRQPVGRDRQL